MSVECCLLSQAFGQEFWREVPPLVPVRILTTEGNCRGITCIRRSQFPIHKSFHSVPTRGSWVLNHRSRSPFNLVTYPQWYANGVPVLRWYRLECTDVGFKADALTFWSSMERIMP